MKFDVTITLGNVIAAVSFLFGAFMTIWKINKIRSEDHEIRLKKLEESCVRMTACTESIKKALDHLWCVKHPEEYWRAFHGQNQGKGQ